jgi:signal transduction histidine kinase
MPEDHSQPAPPTLEHAKLLSLAAHEFRTPASVVGGYLRMLQNDTDQPLSERQRKMVDEAAKSCARLVALIGELSDIGKLDSGTAPMKEERFDLFADLEEVARNVHEGQDREVMLRVDGNPTGAAMRGDRQRLNAAFAAIFRALLREQPTAVTVVADRRIVRSGGPTAADVVVAPEAAVQRAYASRRGQFDENRGGVGLSLPIARRIIERAGGRIWSPAPEDDLDRSLRSAAIVTIPLTE